MKVAGIVQTFNHISLQQVHRDVPLLVQDGFVNVSVPEVHVITKMYQTSSFNVGVFWCDRGDHSDIGPKLCV